MEAFQVGPTESSLFDKQKEKQKLRDELIAEEIITRDHPLVKDIVAEAC